MSSRPLDPELYEEVKADAKRKFKVWPSAYASGWLVQEYKRRGGRYAPRRNPAEGRYHDYMALPSVLELQAQAEDVVTYLEKAQREGRPLEDWVESKITSMAKDMEDVHGYVVYGEKARERAPRQNPPLNWHLRNDSVEDMLIGLVRRTGRTEDLLAILADYYANSAGHERNPEMRRALSETAQVLDAASERIARIYEDME